MSSKLNQRFLIPALMVLAGVILILCSLYWLFNSTQPPAPRSPASPTPVSSGVSVPYPDLPRLSLADAKAAYELGTAVFIDVRGEPYYSQGHIPGALSIPEDELYERLDELDPSAWIITY